jgi:hypothetical protein
MATLCAYYGFKCALARDLSTLITPRGNDLAAFVAVFDRFYGVLGGFLTYFMVFLTVFDLFYGVFGCF